MAKGEKTGGRSKGTPNKATADTRKTIALIADRNVAKLEDWLTRVAEDDPAKAADLFLRMIEYHVPKLARTEVTDPEGGPVTVVHRIERVVVRADTANKNG